MKKIHEREIKREGIHSETDEPKEGKKKKKAIEQFHSPQVVFCLSHSFLFFLLLFSLSFWVSNPHHHHRNHHRHIIIIVMIREDRKWKIDQ